MLISLFLFLLYAVQLATSRAPLPIKTLPPKAPIAIQKPTPTRPAPALPTPVQPTSTRPTPQHPSPSPTSAEQTRRIQALTNVFEHGTPTIEYATVEALDDGRGYTAGRAGFTTATGDAYLVVQRFTDQVPNTVLAQYLPELKRLANEESSEVEGLEGFPDAWRRAARDERFRRVQDRVNDELYYQPALSAAQALSVQTALGRAILYDTYIQHGGGTGPDSASAIIRRATTSAGGTPKQGVSEKTWLMQFLRARKENLLHPADEDSREVWAASAGRVDVLSQLLEQDNLELRGPIRINTPSYEAVIP